MNLKSQMLTSILGVAEAPSTWIPGFLLDEARPTFIPRFLDLMPRPSEQVEQVEDDCSPREVAKLAHLLGSLALQLH